MSLLFGERAKIVTYQEEKKKEQGWEKNLSSEHLFVRYIVLVEKSGCEEVDVDVRRWILRRSNNSNRKSILGNERGMVFTSSRSFHSAVLYQ